MTPSFTRQAAAAVLSALVTLGAFAGVAGIATHQVATTQAMVIAQAQIAAPKIANT